MKFVTCAGLAIFLIAVASTALFLSLGPSRFWNLFREPDLSSVEFQNLVRSPHPNDALACPPGTCAAAAEITPPAFGVSAADLGNAFRHLIETEPRVEVIASGAGSQDIYIQRSRVLGFPDVIVVSFIDLPDGRSTLAVYSRSVLGRSDFGVNKARIHGWRKRLSEAVPPLT